MPVRRHGPAIVRLNLRTGGYGLAALLAMRHATGDCPCRRTRRGAPIPWGNIPARPYLGLSADDETEVVRILRDYLERQTG